MARKAKATEQLLEQVNVICPNRNKSDNGWIGDKAHQATKSEHNPNSKGVVRAIDITHDPNGGCDSYRLAQVLLDAQDPRMMYVISNRKIGSGPRGPSPGRWRPYSGKNPHDQHCHISVGKLNTYNGSDASLYDDDAEWDLSGFFGVAQPDAPRRSLPQVKRKDKGGYVTLVQTLLGAAKPDGSFGPMTEQSVIQFQRDHGLVVDGVVGIYTWRELLRPWAKEVHLLPDDPKATLYQMAEAALKMPGATPEQVYTAFLAILTDILPPGLQATPPSTPVEPGAPDEPVPPVPPPDEPGAPTAEKEYHAMVEGGFFSSDPDDTNVPTSIRTNNPGALNTTKYIATLPGYAGSQDYAGKGNHTAIFWSPEYGVLAYWDLLRRYREAGATTIRAIITKYGGGQDYSEYLTFVTKTTGLPSTYQVKIDGSDDANLIKFAKAMWRYEAGTNTPLNDAQIKAGFALGREHARMVK